MRSSRKLFVGAALSATACCLPAFASTEARQLIALKDKEQRVIDGIPYVARGETLVASVLSTEFATVAVLEGALETLTASDVSALAGEALVTPIERGGTNRFAFDAARLSATLRPDWVERARPPLQKLAAEQKRKRFWGMLRPTGVNARAPSLTVLEDTRAAYLSDPAVARIRQASGGDEGLMANIAAMAFVTALKNKDAATAAALLDPWPFSDAVDNPALWQSAKRGFAEKLLGDAALSASVAQATEIESAFRKDLYVLASPAGRYLLHLVKRDSAVFIGAVEADAPEEGAGATGFTGQDLAIAARTASIAGDRPAELRSASETLRLALALQPQIALTKMPADQKSILESAFGALTDQRTLELAWLMAGSQVVDVDVTGKTRLFNPIAGTAVALDWSATPAGLALASVRGEAPGEGVGWASRPGETYLAALTAMQAGRGTLATGDILFAESRRWIEGLAGLAADPEGRSGAEAVMKAIADGKAVKLGKDGATLDSLPQPVRATFVPLTRFKRNGGSSILFGSALYPQLLVAADLDGAETPALTVINLKAKQEKAQ